MALVPLSEHKDTRWSAAEIDVRGWTVRTGDDGARAGTVHDLLIDREGRPLYLDIDLGPLRKHVLVPIGHARAEPRRREVRIPGFTRRRLEEIPAWEHRLGQLTREYEDGLATAYARAYGDLRRRPRPPYAGTIYGPSELESPVRIEGAPAFAPLSRLPDHRIADREPDPRGWPVRTADGADVGAVEELLVDTTALKVSHLAVRTTDAAGGERILVPASFVYLDAGHRIVRLDLDSSDALDEFPVWDGRMVPESLGPRPGYYDHPRFSARRFLGGQRR